VKKQYGEKMEAWLKKQPMRDGNKMSISDTYTRGHDWKRPKVVENVLPYLRSKIT
jgi:hypothetical protein